MRIGLISAAALLLWQATAALSSAQSEDDSILGSSTVSESALTGILYDLKQTDQHKPGVSNTFDYDKVITSFIDKGWDESVLNHFYRVSHPFYTTQIFIPMLSNKAAPKAFGVDNRIKDGYWVVHYKGQIIPPTDGRYRFAGYAHATLIAAINGQTVLDGCCWNTHHAAKDFPLAADAQTKGPPAGDGKLRIGPWFELKHSEPVNIDILVGNRMATELCAFLLVQKENETDPVDPATQAPILPMFQVARYDGPPFPQGRLSSPCQVNTLLWKCLQ